MESPGLRLGEHLLQYMYRQTYSVTAVVPVNLLIECLSQLTYGCKQAESYHKKFGQIGPGRPKLAAKKLVPMPKMSVCACCV